jgi:hypothetical protein
MTLGGHEVLITMILFLYIGYSLFGISLPWSWGHNGFVGAEKSTFAMNYLIIGFKDSKLGQITNIGSVETGQEEYSYYIHHPIGMALLVSLSFLIFGINEWSARLIPIIINSGTIFFLYFFTKQYWTKNIGVFSIFFLVLNPMFFYTRNFVAMEVLVVFFTALMLCIYVRWLRDDRPRTLYLLFLIFVLGTLSDWQFYFVVPPLIVHYFGFVKKKKKDKRLLFLLPGSVLTFLMYLAHVRFLTGSITGSKTFTGNLFETLLFRLNLSETSKSYNITLMELVRKIFGNFSFYYTKILLLATIFFIILFLFNVLTKKNVEKEALPFLIFLSFLSSFFIFSNLTWIHDFLLLFLNPFVAVFGAIMIENSWKIAREKRSFKIISIILFIIILAIFINDFYKTNEKIYHDNNRIEPIIDFLSNNNDDIIVSFDVHPQAYAFRFYLSKVKVSNIRSKKNLIELLNAEKKYRFVLVREKTILKNFLTPLYHKREIDGYTIFDLRIPLSSTSLLEIDAFPKPNSKDLISPRLALFDPVKNSTYDTDEIVLNAVSNEPCYWDYSWNGLGRITGPNSGQTLNVLWGESTNDKDENIILEYHLNEKVGTISHDDSGKDNHGITNNVDWINGKFGSATGYDGLTSYIRVDDSPSLRISGEELTITAWIWIEDESIWRPIIRKGSNGQLNFLLLVTPGNKLGFRMDNVVDHHLESKSSIPINRWTHVAATYNGSTLTLYIDGEPDISKKASGNLIDTSNQDLTIGREIDQNVWFSGLIDEILVWNRSLTGAEIKKVYNPKLPSGSSYVEVYCRDANNNKAYLKSDFIIK